MRKWIALIAVLPLLWSSYWFVGSSNLKSEISDWLTDRRTDGWQVEYTDLRVNGFPNRFDATLKDVQLADPDTGISWTAPFFQALSLSYKPNHWIAVWPKSQTFSTPYQRVDISSEDMRASLVFTPTSDMTLERSTIIASDISMISSADWNFDIESLSSSVRQMESDTEYEYSLEINSLKPSQNLRTWLDQKNNLPDIIENISINFKTDLTKPLDRHTLEDGRPQIRALDISQAKATWGELLLRVSGDLLVANDGEITGDLALNAKNWREMLQLAVSSGSISAEMATAAEFGLGLLARLGGSDTTLDSTVTFNNGRMFLGPIPLGAAPKLILR